MAQTYNNFLDKKRQIKQFVNVLIIFVFKFMIKIKLIVVFWLYYLMLDAFCLTFIYEWFVYYA
ncbi:hypothetical protein Q766_09180 [Flavobacterium subsaxonicum WB 4.1-42 = DSM 21790]|uniref:Uncharacterized protein n=1 Tax=Flavobacterium subsaxonicum WB 4.1-42 = DSM 21790 TaxID=1121898 RepID=A0A0A2MZ04_9FLAO|nr:hypothetical protein Q766_09180 [Flavobacterium subsaxonicum WB 4.1-42 = DSM 21790]